jgi:MFS family permease
MKINGKYLGIVAAMCGLSAATVGLITNVAGLFFGPMAEEFGVMQGAASLTLTIANVCMAVGGLFTRRLTKAMPLRVLLVAGVVLLAGSSALTALAPSIAVVYAASAVKGFAAGVIGFVLITYVLGKWFQAQLGIATSMAMGCSGLAGAIFSPVIQGVVAGMGWRAGQLLVAALMVVFTLPAILLVPSCDPADSGLLPYGADGSQAKAVTTSKKKADKVSVDKLVFIAVVVYSGLCAAVSALPQHFPGMAGVAGLGASVGATMISMCMITNTAGKILMGWLCDRIGARASILAYTALTAVAIVVLLLVPAATPYIVAALVSGLCYSLATVGLTMLCNELFGRRGSGIVYPVGAMACSLSNAVFSSVIGFAYDLTGGYAVMLVAFVAFLVAADMLVLWGYRRTAATTA